jgi:hypothetical protein
MQFATDVVQFVDGTEQRFCAYTQPYHSWIVKFNDLDDGELQNIRAFVQQMDGAAGLFSFTDPWDGTVYPTCNLQGDTETDALTGPFQSGTSLIIQENRT